jgi:hypothetical protein
MGEIIVPKLVDDIAENIKIQCDNELDKLAIYNILLSKWSSVIATKNIMTDSCRHIQPCPLAYYGLNLLPSGGNKNKPLTAVETIFKWIDNEYEVQNENNKKKYIECAKEKLNDTNNEKEIEKIEKRAENLLKLKSKTNSATAQKIYAICENIVKSNFGSLFIYDTEFIKKFEAKINGKSLDDTLDTIYNLYDGTPDFIDTVLTDRDYIGGISCNVCYASDFSRLLRNQKTNREFKNYLQDGFARRLFLYSSKNVNGLQVEVELPTVEELNLAKNQLVEFYQQTKSLYEMINPTEVYEFSTEANIFIQKYHQQVKKRIKKEFSYTEVLSDDDEILKVNLNGSTWKIVKTAFLFHFIENPTSYKVSKRCVEMAIGYFNAFHEHLKLFLDKKPIDKLDEYKNFIYKNLDVEMVKNSDFRKGLGIHYNYWVDFCKTTLSMLIAELQTENIYVQETKQGKREIIKFYKMEG